MIGRGLPEPEEFDLRRIDDDDLAALPGGIHCADDIADSGWMFSMVGLLGGVRFC